MSVSILEVLINAKYNLCEGKMPMQTAMGKEQLNNAVSLLEKGYSTVDIFDEIIEEFGSVENAPEK